MHERCGSEMQALAPAGWGCEHGAHAGDDEADSCSPQHARPSRAPRHSENDIRRARGQGQDDEIAVRCGEDIENLLDRLPLVLAEKMRRSAQDVIMPNGNFEN
jgi:hypothetical protein